ncbi:MAG: radical SAM protein [Chloroflexi bacterium]|nr:radical SAM protein [Chloroflexota bacterium]
MTILLLNPKLNSWSPNVYVPLGLAYIAAALEQASYSVEIIDLNVEKISDNELQRKTTVADMVGITGMVTEHEGILRLVDTIKKANAETGVILGGPLATTLPREMLQSSRADFVVIGEGEKTIVNLVSAIKHGDNFSDIKGIAYKDGDRTIVAEPAEPIANLDTIPFPARHLLDMNRYLQNHFERFGFKVKDFGKIKSTNLVSSRGCPYSCTFCFKGMWGRTWRARSPENIIDEMELLYREYGVNGFFFNDDTFVLDRKRIFEFCQLLKVRGLKVAWYCNGRINLMTKELLEAMYDAGCRGIAYGIESGTQQILDSMKKNVALDRVRTVVKYTREAGIYTTGYFMIGMLGENRTTIRKTMSFARELELDYYGFSLTTPLIGTELYDHALEAGLIERDGTSPQEWSLHVNANLTDDCSDAELAAFESEAFKEFFLKKRFGKYYFFNPNFLKEELAVLLSLRHKAQAKELANKVKGIVSSYWHKG